MNRKKIILTAFLSLFLGCAQTQISTKSINPKEDITLLQKYGITKDSLIADKNYYYFVNIEPNGISVNKLDKNYNLVAKKIFHLIIDPKKALIKDNYLYILGYDNKKQKPILLQIDTSNLKLKKTIYLDKTYSLPADFFVKKEIYTAINRFSKKTQSDIYIYKNKSFFSKIASDKKESATFILPYKDKILIAGNITFVNDDIFIALIDKNGKVINAKRIDLGMDDYVKKVEIKNNKIIINAISTDNMGAEIDYTLILDKNLNAIKSKKNLEFKELPVKLRT